MLELTDLCFTIEKDNQLINLVDRVTLTVPSRHFMAIVGPSGCGKTTLLNTIAGLNLESEGMISWNGKDLAKDGDIDPVELGYVPQFSIAYEELTVDESIEAVTKLRVKTKNLDELDHRIDRVLEETGLSAIADRPVKVLSGGQKRRLGLAMELVTDPKLLLCDEVTSGLDPRSERDIVRQLHQLSRNDGRIVISVTHSLAHLELYDSILVLHEGKVAYHGPSNGLTHYFSVEDTEEIYPKLAQQSSESWRKSWVKHRDTFYTKMEARRKQTIKTEKLETSSKPISDSAEMSETQAIEEDDETVDTPSSDYTKTSRRSKRRNEHKTNQFTPDIVAEEAEAVTAPGFYTQFSTLLTRRLTIFFRDRAQVILQITIMICFPLLVALFADQASPAMPKFPDQIESLSVEAVNATKKIAADRATLAGAVSGIVMFQIVLLSLMGSNNSAREIAGERRIMEKEKFGGVSTMAYLSSKLVFLGGLVLVQSIWMAIFVQQFWVFKDGVSSGFLDHLLFLIMVNAAITSICLGISSLMKTSEQASLLSIYLVGFQLPLSGAVLALPSLVGSITRPFIAAYWSWSGSVESMDNSYRQAISDINSTPLSQEQLCILVLSLHIIIGIGAAFIGIRRHQWEH